MGGRVGVDRRRPSRRLRRWVWRRSFDREDEARALIDSMMKRSGGRAVRLDMTSLVQDSPRRRG